MEEIEQQEEREQTRGRGRRLWYWAKRFALITFGLFVFFSLFFQIPAVQNWAVRAVTGTLSRQMQTEVRVDHLYFAWFDRLRLNDFWVQDYDQDTLLYSRQLEANFNLNPITLLMRGIEIESIHLRDAQLNLERPKDELKTNLQRALEKLSNPDTLKQRKRPVRLNLKRLGLDNVRFSKEDLVRGNTLAITLGRGRISVNEMDLPNKLVDIETADLRGLQVGIDTYEWQDSLFNVLNQPTLLPPDSLQTDTAKFLLMVEDLRLADGRFRLDNYRKDPEIVSRPDELDYRHLDVYDIQLKAECFAVRDWHFYGEFAEISAREGSGFELTMLSADQVSVTPRQVALYDVLLKTPDSEIGDTLRFEYERYLDWQDFVNKVEMEARINNAKVKLRDIITFAPGLKENIFFGNNSEETLIVDGLVTGAVNDLSSRDLVIRLTDNNTRIKGRLAFHDLTVPNAQRMNLRLDYLITNMRTLRQLLPSVNPPPNFDRLGNLYFKGRFDGFFVDFVAKGDLRSSIGRAVIDDIRMNLKDGRERASYSGTLQLIDFDLGRWSQNPDLGTITLNSELINGQGLTPTTASADVNARIESFTYKGYLYENAIMSGRLYENFFNGDFSIQDDNVDFGFTGKVDLTDTLPRFDFSAEVKKLDLKQLNLSQRDLVLDGQVDLILRNASLSDLRGTLEMKDFTIVENDTSIYHLDALFADSDVDTAGNKVFVARSEIVETEARGKFDIGQLPDIFLQYLRRNFPDHTRQWGVNIREKELNESDFTYRIRIDDSQGFNRLLDPKLGRIIGAAAEGYYRSEEDELEMSLDIPELSYGTVEWKDIAIDLEGEGDEGELNLIVGSTLINNKQELPAIILNSVLFQDTVLFGLNYASSSGGGLLDDLTLNGRLNIVDSLYYRVRFNQSNLVILENVWAIDENNSITFGNQYLETQNFVLTNRDRLIRLNRVGKKGLRLFLEHFDFDFIEDIWEYEPLNFSGKFDMQAEVRDMYTLRGVRATVLSDTFRINGDDWGQFQLNMVGEDFKHALQGQLTLSKDTSQLFAEGYVNPARMTDGFRGEELPDNRQAGFFEFDVDVYHYPLWLARYFLGNTIENVEGAFNADLTFYGLPGRPKVDGQLNVREGALTISYLKTRYYIPEAVISADSTFFNASGNTLFDKYGNVAYLYGGIRHDYLKDFRFDAKLSTDGFLGVDTKKGDNNMFYGHVLGRGDVRFTGSFQQPNIYVNAIVGDTLSRPSSAAEQLAIPPTRLVIPISYEREASELKFIRFVDKSAIDPGGESARDPADLTGLSLEMDLSVTEEARMEIVFDEQAGDIIRGNGNGNIRILMPRGGDDFRMFGDYVIESGNYLFTLYGVVSKEFSITQGGTINWNGDPFAAEINIEAQYKDLNASVATFIQEYIGSGLNGQQDRDLVEDANQVTAVDLSMNLTGPLLQPIINFDIAFPDLTGRLKSYTDSKLRVLKQDPNELNRQVFGLIVVGQFISSDLVSQSSNIIYNTVSEFVSNQLSLLLTELFSEFITDGRVLSGIDFDIAYNQYKAANVSREENITPGDEIEVRLKQDFFNDRLSILVGGNVDFGGSVPGTQQASGAFVGNDVVLEYVISKDRSLKLRFYQRLEPNITGRRLQVGGGLSFRKEYDSFSDFIRSLKRSGREKGR